MDFDQMHVPALGRPFAIGMLYDARQDQLLADFNLWDRETIKKFTIRKTQNSSDYDTIASDTIAAKTSLLKADESLTASVLSGLIDIGASANYLNDKKEFRNQSRVILHYKATTAYERLDMNHQDAKKLQARDVIKYSHATHVVTGILYGANAFFVFDSERLDSSSLLSMEGSMQSLIKKIPKLDPKGNMVRNLREAEKSVMEKVSCKFYGDFILERNPTTFEEAAETFRNLPGLLGKDGEKSVPVKIWLSPLKNLDSSAAQLKGSISDVVLKKAENVWEGIREIQMRCNEIQEREEIKIFPQIQRTLKSFQDLCADYMKTVQQTMQEKILLIREGEEEEEEEESLENFVDQQENSPFNKKNLNIWLDNLDREINVIASCLDIMKGIKIIPEKSDLDREVLSVENALCFVFTSIEMSDAYMDQMASYLKKTQNFVTPPAKDQWFFSDEVLENIKEKANMIAETAKGLRSSGRFHFLVTALPNQGLKGATIYHYSKGVLKTKDFAKPAILRVRNVTDKQDLMWYSCDLTLDPETVNGYLTLSAGDKKATSGSWEKYPKTEKRFDWYPQVLCREGLRGCHYFEVKWSSEKNKDLGIGLAYESNPRKGNRKSTGFGYNDVSWYFGVNDNVLRAWHGFRKDEQLSLPTGCNKIGVYLDWPAGTLSFYTVSSDTLTHLFTFEKRFTEALYPGFYIYEKNNFAMFCPV
ncbi:stonustoxin subunit beta-like [Cyprinodon tularosa]|uniref:stonustoxin subunit beta-like n=1 Tax=Cyprinodon tularosa TaxID=77115 RepID=UPI0018E1EBFB|nr:stonustoxin subunit beta-like [Cyprinodon tularosa]